MHNCAPARTRAALLGSLLLVACASNVPLEIREAPADSPTLQEALADPDSQVSREVRWGGLILETENTETSTRVTVLALPLSSSGKPQVGDDSGGRFVAIVPGFLDPTVYSKDRRFTVSGTITGSETRKVGEFPYRYPVVEARQHYLWPVEPQLPPRYRDPWWYDPWWYDPWYYPWRPYRYPYGY
jgi:outer membrane lipoprotein